MKNYTSSLLEKQAQEIVGFGDDWMLFRFEYLDGTTPGMMVTGAKTPFFVRGAKKGRPNWKKRDVTTERTIFISLEAKEAYAQAWSKNTGLCIKCEGDGQVVARWSSTEGTEWKDCPKCNGTGKSDV